MAFKLMLTIRLDFFLFEIGLVVRKCLFQINQTQKSGRACGQTERDEGNAMGIGLK